MVTNSAQIRACQKEDEPFLREMLYEALFLPPGHPPFERAILQHPNIRPYRWEFGRAGEEAFLLEVEGKRAGACWIRQFGPEAPGYGFVDTETPELTLALLPSYRGNGWGTQLLQFALAAWAKAGIAQISLSVDQRNPALRLYQREGFQIVATQETTFTMKKRLIPNPTQ
ncbi:MAG: GNAT family N-acetyltransferase [Bacteroidota bacterium]